MFNRRLSVAAMTVALVALVVALGGTAIAQVPIASIAKLVGLNSRQTGQVRSIADGRIAAEAPKLSVRKATNANNLGGTSASGYEKYGATLPSGRTEVGVYDAEFDSPSDNVGVATSAFTFPIPLSSAPTAVLVPSGTSGGTQCPGSPTAPSATPGVLCVYEQGSKDIENEYIYNDSSGQGNAASRWGASVYVTAGSTPTSDAYSIGVWAVEGA